MDKVINRKAVFDAIDQERNYQDKKWGDVEHHPHTVPEWLLIMEEKLSEAKKEWLQRGNSDSLSKVLQIVSVGTACLEQHVVVGRPKPMGGSWRDSQS
jgi:hypothetical protein